MSWTWINCSIQRNVHAWRLPAMWRAARSHSTQGRHRPRLSEGNQTSNNYNNKNTSEGTVSDLIDECSSLLKRYKKHAFNIRHHFAFCRRLQQNLKENECIIQIDFAENYIAKMETEIQSAHFGASKVQITLHTGVYYVGGAENKATSFCSISD